MARRPSLPQVLQRLEGFFEGGVIARGEAYLTRVEVQRRTPARFVARVRGTQPYCAVLGRDGDLVLGHCTCPYFEGAAEPCKHLWATLRVSERMGWLGSPPAPRAFHGDLELDEANASETPIPANDLELDEPAAEDIDVHDDFALDDDDVDLINLDDDDDLIDTEDDSDLDDETLDRFAQSLAARTSWRTALDIPQRSAHPLDREAAPQTRLHYVLLPYELRAGHLQVHLAALPAKNKGVESSDELMPATEAVRRLGPDAHPVERWLMALLRSSAHAYVTRDHAVTLEPGLLLQVVSDLCATGRCHFARRAPFDSRASFMAVSPPLVWDGAKGAYNIEFSLEERGQTTSRGHTRAFQLQAWLTRADERLPASETILIAPAGLVAWPDRIAPVEPSAGLQIAANARSQQGGVNVSESELQAFAEKYYALPDAPALALPPDLQIETLTLAPKPVLELGKPDAGRGTPAQVSFSYGDLQVPLGTPGRTHLAWAARRLLMRDLEAERNAARDLEELGVRPPARAARFTMASRSTVRVPVKKLPAIVRGLLARGWEVEAEGKRYRAAGQLSLKVATGIDWFELDAHVDFNGRSLTLPQLLAALRKGETSVVLDDGSIGLLPEDWLARWGVLTDVGRLERGQLRFRRSELPLLDALVFAAPELDVDAAFEKLRRELSRGPEPADREPPGSLRGELRPYQRDGLAWLRFLKRTGFGGCLADDMGLGKTVQLLAHLADRSRAASGAPALVVAPRSVLFNWEREAARFTPHLRVLTHHGADRLPPGPHFAEHDLILTTYGLIRADQQAFAEQQFSCVVLDEAQAIKNAESNTARAARSLRADQRLALTGTPLENHLGELWSLFDFLNPGLLSHSKRLAQALSKPRSADGASLALVARAVRPFLLRRTKAQVAPDLPERSEQTLYVALSPEERRHYDELAAYYRAAIRQKIETDGLEGATPQVFEALLRLRQAACHPRLIDDDMHTESAAKIELLLERLAEVIEEGHKALVFSQFTALLSIVAEQLDERGVSYEYLDGKTTHRERHVDRFQNDPDLRVFLISLKAGGVGLNLTAADYVFILDPWWNPAAEAQAIDRAHRIGQTRSVMAYRLIARGTVEEKVEALQHQKRALVQAVLGDGAAFGGKLTREDLELLLDLG